MFNATVVANAERVAQEALDDFLSAPRARRAVPVKAIAGGGKTQFVTTAAGTVRNRDLRTAVCSPTNEQVFNLVWRLANRYPEEIVTIVPASRVVVPPAILQMANVVVAHPASASHGARLIVGTFDKLGDAFARGDLEPFDVLLADESFQADSARYYAVAGIAPTHLLVGDPGQLNPFSTMDGADRWRGLPEDPLQTAVGVLLRNHPRTRVHNLPITRRLDSRAVPVARAFYRNHDFDAAILPGIRELRLLPGIARDHRMRVLDQTLDLAARDGWAHVELPRAPVLTADPEVIEFIAKLIRRLAERGPDARCELVPEWTQLDPSRIAVGVSHNDQKDLVRISLNAAGFPAVVVDTANKLQGTEFDVVIAWHPLAGLPDPDGFHLDPGRLCVLLTRHRHACIVVGRTGDRELVEGIPPNTPGYLGWDPDPVLEGWDVHQRVFERLEPYRIVA